MTQEQFQKARELNSKMSMVQSQIDEINNKPLTVYFGRVIMEIEDYELKAIKDMLLSHRTRQLEYLETQFQQL